MAKSKKTGLGRGLGALFETVEIQGENFQEEEKFGLVRININEIKPNANQPRKTFDEEKLQDLASSITENGLIQPIVVRKLEKGYEIVAGERRWRAARKAHLKEVPCIVRELSEQQNMLFAIIENMQREDLNPIEEAEGLENMIETFGMTQEEVSKSVGKSRPYIANSLRLLKLNDEIREMVLEGTLTAAHGRTLLAVDDIEKRKKLSYKIVKEGISVRQLEEIINDRKNSKRGKAVKRKAKSGDIALVERELAAYLGTKVGIKGSNFRGTVEIQYYSPEELNRILEIIKK
mgnify:CR=1 FL=1